MLDSLPNWLAQLPSPAKNRPRVVIRRTTITAVMLPHDAVEHVDKQQAEDTDLDEGFRNFVAEFANTDSDDWPDEVKRLARKYKDRQPRQELDPDHDGDLEIGANNAATEKDAAPRLNPTKATELAELDAYLRQPPGPGEPGYRQAKAPVDTDWWNVDQVLKRRKKQADYAPGISNARDKGDLAKLPINELLTFLRQQHNAHRAGPHEDWRIGSPELGLYSWAVPRGMPVPGEKHLAPRTHLHRHRYKNFEGEIPRGVYGAGTVKKLEEGKALVTQASPGRVEFTVVSRKDPLQFLLHRTSRKDDWFLRNITPINQDRNPPPTPQEDT